MSIPIKTIRSRADYEVALARIDELMQAKPDTEEASELDVWSTLVDLYENQEFPLPMPDPITAITFRMEQDGLSSRDLVPYLGSRAKVSQVLSRKRPLTLGMMRALNKHLRIPAEVLLQDPGSCFPEETRFIDWSRFPVREMAKRGWISVSQGIGAAQDSAEELMRGLIANAGGAPCEVLFRKSAAGRCNAKTDHYGLAAWCLRVREQAKVDHAICSRYQRDSIDQEWVNGLARLSQLNDGPRLAKEYLGNAGIRVVHVEHLPNTYLDGSAMLLEDGSPVIGITIRHDRLDNFWFCLFHELAHVVLHLRDGASLFVDDLSISEHDTSDDPKEKEADEWAARNLIDEVVWGNSTIASNPQKASQRAVKKLAHDLGIHPAIVAGRIRKLSGNYRRLSHFVGQGEVRKHFMKAFEAR